MQSLSKYNRGIRYLLCSIDFFSKYAWVVPLKDKIGIPVTYPFQKAISKGCQCHLKYGLRKVMNLNLSF